MGRAALITAIDAYCAQTGRRPGGVCHMAVGNGKLYDRLRAGGGCNIDTARRLVDWLEANRTPDTHEAA